MRATLSTIRLESTPSTNDYALSHASELGMGTLVLTREQTAGKGQRGNTWDAQPGDIMGTLAARWGEGEGDAYRPTTQQLFALNEAASLGIAEALGEVGAHCEVKWANDLIARDRKLCGVLIETRSRGAHIHFAAIGFGLNITARPTSPQHYQPAAIGLEELVATPPPDLAQLVATRILEKLGSLRDDGQDALHEEYLQRLYRREGLHPFQTAEGSFWAEIADVAPSGALTLRHAGGELRRYLFKEVQHRF